MGRLGWLAMFLLTGSFAACGIGVVGEAEPALLPDREGGVPDASDPAVDAGGDSAAPVDATVDAPFDAGSYATRVTNGLLAFYDFEENTGTTAKDAIVPAADLVFAKSASDTIWKPHALQLTNGAYLQTAGHVDKIETSYLATTEISVEAWVVPEKESGDDYARLVTLGEGSGSRAFALGSVTDDHYWASMFVDEDLVPNTTENEVKKQLTHLVLTRTAAGVLHLFVDGKETGLLANVGDPSGFQSYKLGVGNLASGDDKHFSGEVHLVAIYNHALTQAEVDTNHLAGPDP